jgi:hypothetical protein
MKAYKVELLIIDFDEIGEEEIRYQIENTKFSNNCISPHIKSIHSKDIGEFHDSHPLNLKSTCDDEYKRLFGLR